MSRTRVLARARRTVPGLIVAGTVALGAVACSSSATMPDQASPPVPVVADGAPPTTARAEPAARPQGVDDSSPAAAVTSFAAAEAAEAYDLSLPLLTSADRETVGELDAWTDRHGSLWPLAGAEVTDVAEDGTTATVTTRLTYHAQLDETLGLVPARATGVWKVVREDDRWRISLADLEVTPSFADDRGAVPAAQDWSTARQRCEASPDQYAGGLVGFPTVADALCGTSGAIAIGSAARLSEGPDGDAFVAAFGPQVLSWARIVPVESPTSFRAVLAPVGDRWIVAGLLPPR